MDWGLALAFVGVAVGRWCAGMMTDEETFLAGIYADPDADWPRLVSADWLEEQGRTERAEFIRLQCRIARGDPYDLAEGDRMSDLADQHRQAWAGHLPKYDGTVWEFRRGSPRNWRSTWAHS